MGGLALLVTLGVPLPRSDDVTNVLWPYQPMDNTDLKLAPDLAPPQSTVILFAFCFNPATYIILYQGLILSLCFLKLYCDTLCYILMHFASAIPKKMSEMIYNSYLFLLLANSML